MSEGENSQNLLFEAIDWICSKLESSKIQYMITGGVAIAFWGQIRTTMDIDILVELNQKNSEPFLKSFRGEEYLDIDTAHKAIRDKKIFNIIPNNISYKFDIITLDDQNDYERQKFIRRVKMKFLNRGIYVVSPEDLIISKLMWSKSTGGSERQLRDCQGVYKLNEEQIDKKYLEKWTIILGIESDVKKIIG